MLSARNCWGIAVASMLATSGCGSDPVVQPAAPERVAPTVVTSTTAVKPTNTPSAAAPASADAPVDCKELEGLAKLCSDGVEHARAWCSRASKIYAPAVADGVQRCLRRASGKNKVQLCELGYARRCVVAALDALDARLTPADGCDPPPSCYDSKPSLWTESCNAVMHATLPTQHDALRRCMRTACDPLGCFRWLAEQPEHGSPVEVGAGTRGGVVVSAPNVTGAARPEASRVVARQRGRVRRCYEHALRMVHAQHEVTITATVSLDQLGKVKRVEVSGNDGTLGETTTCVAMELFEQDWGSSSGASTVEFSSALQPVTSR